jgi:hypothetical protein
MGVVDPAFGGSAVALLPHLDIARRSCRTCVQAKRGRAASSLAAHIAPNHAADTGPDVSRSESRVPLIFAERRSCRPRGLPVIPATSRLPRLFAKGRRIYAHRPSHLRHRFRPLPRRNRALIGQATVWKIRAEACACDKPPVKKLSISAQPFPLSSGATPKETCSLFVPFGKTWQQPCRPAWLPFTETGVLEPVNLLNQPVLFQALQRILDL